MKLPPAIVAKLGHLKQRTYIRHAVRNAPPLSGDQAAKLRTLMEVR